MVSLLRDPQTAWDRPAMTTHGRGNHAVRSEHYRYIRYADGSEELYDHRVDPMEWNNLAANPDMEIILKSHADWLPEREAKDAESNVGRRGRNSLENE